VEPLYFIIIRAVVVYLFVIIAIRIFGKREISQLSVIDLVFILLISNSVQNAMVGPSSSLFGGFLAAGTLFLINYVLGNLFFKYKRFSNLIQGQPLMLVYNGRVIPGHLRQAKISVDELEAAIREHGVKTIDEVNLAVLERDGNISVLSDNYKHKTTRMRKAHKVVEREVD
jgi:uncharacterized membrane protein YcaP (DUF421 family)